MALLAVLILFVIATKNASAAGQVQSQADRQLGSEPQAAGTPVPTVSPSISPTETAESRTLPSVGDNAYVVLGASVLVLIIIGGVVFSTRRKPKH